MEYELKNDENVLIRTVEISDLPAIRNIYNHSVQTSVFTLDLDERTEEDFLNWFQSHIGRYPACVVTLHNTPIGFGSLSKWAERKGYNPSCEASIYLSPENCAQGYGDKVMAW